VRAEHRTASDSGDRVFPARPDPAAAAGDWVVAEQQPAAGELVDFDSPVYVRWRVEPVEQLPEEVLAAGRRVLRPCR
jgi:hypothetical protein